MEHIVQFAINIDDQTIKDRLEKNAYNDICDKLVKEAKGNLPKRAYSSAVDWTRVANDCIGDFIVEHKDEVIDAAAEKLCESFKRTKAYKEKMKDTMDHE